MRPPAAPSVRPLTPADHAAWIGLRQALWLGSDATTLAAEAGTLLTDPQRFGALRYAVLLAVDGERPTGFVEVSLRDDLPAFAGRTVGYVEGVYVAPPHRRRGLGQALIEAAAGWARAAGRRRTCLRHPSRQSGKPRFPPPRGLCRGRRERERRQAADPAGAACTLGHCPDRPAVGTLSAARYTQRRRP